ncbi:hypothetical protein VSDG_04092 [Cytospora chrysosperma]|uniref:Uncharacterized protein n=1 Tax=Cytospora chrysosperma TaxID=252740 RepID=A0A423W0S6_CYTCH|nr:hypothetical protein VSDG_04092 [Valsa sordida]
MQFSATFLALASAMAVSATPAFTVSDFSASCVPHSGQCLYSFSCIRPQSMDINAIKCSKMVTGSDGSLPTVPEGTCEQSSRTWAINKNADGSLLFQISWPVSRLTNETASYTIPATDLTFSTTGASTQQSYTGPTTFDMY